jgi:hypothetical protein
MISATNRKSLRVGATGLFLQIGCPFLLFIDPDRLRNWPLLAILSIGTLTGSGLFIVWLGYYAKGKGYSRISGLLGLLSFFGLLIVAFLPDKKVGTNED